MNKKHHSYLNKEQKKNILKFYTHNKNNLIKIPFDFDKKSNFFKKYYNSLSAYEIIILKKFNSLSSAEFLEIKQKTIDSFFEILELSVNEYVVYQIIDDLIYDLNNHLYDIRVEKNTLDTAIPINTNLYCDLDDYNNISDFLTSNYEDKLRPFYHDYTKLTLYPLKQGYIEQFDFFISELFNDVLKETLENYISPIDFFYWENFNLMNELAGKEILFYILTEISRPYLDNILNYKIENLFNLYNLPDYSVILTNINNRTEKQKVFLKNIKNFKLSLENFICCLKNLKNTTVEIGDIVFFTNEKTFEKNLFFHLYSLILNKKSFSFIIQTKTNIENFFKYSGFIFFEQKGIMFFKKEDFNLYFKKRKSHLNNKYNEFIYKKEILNIFDIHNFLH